MDTIFALASARGRAGVAVIRVSGPSAFDAAEAIAGAPGAPRRASLRTLRDPGGEAIDEAIVLRFEGSESFTGEDTVEFQTHGSPAVVSRLLRTLAERPGLRQAEAGEFTRRALENDRLDLARVEGLADLVEAETEAQRRQAMRVMEGRLRERVEGWREDLVRAMALVEATMDFADEDVPGDVSPEVLDILGRVSRSLDRELEGARWAERVRDGFRVAILGPPNAGKSTLLNHLAGRDVAITSDVAGTTRDVIEARMDLDGIPVTFQDTAGLREARDEVERIGIDRARAAAEAADLRIRLVEDGDGESGIPESRPGDIVVRCKDDRGEHGGVSGLTGHGVDRILREVAAAFEGRVSSVGVATRERHRAAIALAREAVGEAESRVREGAGRAELAAEELRRAALALESLVGRVDVEHILDDVFSRFCIGK